MYIYLERTLKIVRYDLFILRGCLRPRDGKWCPQDHRAGVQPGPLPCDTLSKTLHHLLLGKMLFNT